MRRRLAIVFLSGLLATSAAQAREARLDANAVEKADWGHGRPGRALIAKAEIILDRLRVSPGVIDGRPGENLRKAIAEFQKQNDLKETGRLDEDTWNKLSQGDGGDVLTQYTITADDVKGPFTKHIPRRMEAQAKLHHLGYHNAAEGIAEKFHTSVAFLKALNPHKRLDEKGTTITVPDVAGVGLGHDPVARIVVDKPQRDLRAFDADGKLLAFFPASIGSRDKPAPSGTLKVTRISKNPTYTYNPKYHFKGVHAQHKFTIPAGPNNPVGLVWIALTGEGYGIHGTPEPQKVSKSASHGCIRLTNWDALELAADVKKGIPVEFRD